MPCDPRQASEIADATVRWIRANVSGAADASWEAPLEAADSGTTTYIWFGRLRGANLPDRFRDPLVLRVYGELKDDETLELERSILEFVAARAYPAPAPLAAVPSGLLNPVGLPWMIQPHEPGVPLLAVLTKALWAAPARLRELAALQARLHAIPAGDCPLAADGPLVDRWFAHRGSEIEDLGNVRADAVFDTLRRRADVVRDEERVVCHGDFHPLNVLSSRRDKQWHHVVIDWTEAVVGDRHYDVARTLVLFRLAAIAASSTAERIGLRAVAPGLVRVYQRAYERAHPLETDRLRYWSAAHLLRGWAQITRLHEGAYATTRATTDAIPLSVAELVLGRAERAASSFA